MPLRPSGQRDVDLEGRAVALNVVAGRGGQGDLDDDAVAGAGAQRAHLDAGRCAGSLVHGHCGHAQHGGTGRRNLAGLSVRSGRVEEPHGGELRELATAAPLVAGRVDDLAGGGLGLRILAATLRVLGHRHVRGEVTGNRAGVVDPVGDGGRLAGAQAHNGRRARDRATADGEVHGAGARGGGARLTVAEGGEGATGTEGDEGGATHGGGGESDLLHGGSPVDVPVTRRFSPAGARRTTRGSVAPTPADIVRTVD